MSTFKRLVRFTPPSSSTVLIGQPVDDNIDVGLAVKEGKEVSIDVFSGSSVLSAGSPTGKIEKIGTLLAPLGQSEVGTIRCVGLNYVQHAHETKLDIPTVPTIFMKPNTALADPSAPCVIPKHVVPTDSCDYESELAIVIGKTAKNVSEKDAADYVLGYTACNDVSSRAAQFAQTQWSYSKGFDGACPIGPTLVSASVVKPTSLHIRGLKNGKVLQDCGINDLIFSVEKIVSFVSQGTTLQPGTIIITGTPAGVGFSYDPKEYLRDGDEFAVEILPSIGTLVTKFVEER